MLVKLSQLGNKIEACNFAVEAENTLTLLSSLLLLSLLVSIVVTIVSSHWLSPMANDTDIILGCQGLTLTLSTYMEWVRLKKPQKWIPVVDILRKQNNANRGKMFPLRCDQRKAWGRYCAVYLWITFPCGTKAGHLRAGADYKGSLVYKFRVISSHSYPRKRDDKTFCTRQGLISL